MYLKKLKLPLIMAMMFGLCLGCTSTNEATYPQEVPYTEHTYTETELRECLKITFSDDYADEFRADEFRIINSQKELENVFCETNRPSVDFAKSTLLVYAFKTRNPLEKANKTIINLSKNKYECKIKAVQYSPYDVICTYCFVAIVDKIPTEATVVFLFDENIN